MQKCPVCNASFPATQFVCSYCGHVETNRIKKIDADTVKTISFTDSMTVIKENLNALQEIRRPKAAGNLLAILRIIVAIQTFGIVLLFWKKPKDRYRPKEFNKLKGIIARNIELLKLSAKGSDELQDRTDVVEKELNEIDKEIKRSLLVRRVVTIVTIIAYLSLIFINKGNKHNDTEIIPSVTTVAGDLHNNIELVIDKYPLNYSINSDKNIKELRVTAKLKIINKYSFTDNEYLHISMVLENKDAKKISGFDVSILDKRNTDRLKKAVEKGAKRTISLSFHFVPNNEIESIPVNLEKFSVTAVIDTIPAE